MGESLAARRFGPAWVWYGAWLGLLAACGSSTEPENPNRIDPSWVVDSVRAFLAPDGRFRLPDHTEFADEMGKQDAHTLGVALMAVLAGMSGGVVDYVESGHGGPIDFAKLQPCDRTVFHRSPFEPIESQTANPIRNVTGGVWSAPMCEPGRSPAVLLWVAARSRVQLVDGVLKYPTIAGADFTAFGVPLIAPERTFQSAERAASLVYQKTGTRIAAVPWVLHDPYYIGPVVANGRPLGALWVVEVEHPVPALRAGEPFMTTRFFVSSGFGQLPLDGVYLDGKDAVQPFVIPFRYELAGGVEVVDSILIEPRFPLTLSPFVPTR